MLCMQRHCYKATRRWVGFSNVRHDDIREALTTPLETLLDLRKIRFNPIEILGRFRSIHCFRPTTLHECFLFDIPLKTKYFVLHSS